MPFCMVSGCSSKSNKTTSSKGIILHVFPSDVDRIKVWLRQTGQDFGNINTFARRVLDSKKTNIFRICSEHFTPGSYVTNISKKILRDDAMPTIFPNRDIVLSPYSKKPRMDAGGIAGHNVKPMPRGDDSTPGDLYHNTRGNGRQASPYLGIKIVKVDTDLNCSMKDPDTSTATDLDTEDCSYIDHKVFTCDKSCQCPEHGNDFESKLWKIEKVTFSSQNLIPKNQITLLDSANPDDFKLVPVETSGCEVAGKALQRAGVQLAVDRTFIMFESCLDDVLKQVPCACGERICAVDKVLEGTYLCAIGVCFGGHKSFTWKSQPVRALISVDSIQTALQFSRGNGDSNKTSLMENQQNQPPSTSPDASRSSIIPERCFSPLYSQNAAQEHRITHKCQDDSLAVIKEEKYLYERSVGPCKEVEIPPEISTDSRDTRSSQGSGQAEEEKERNEIKDEDILLGIDTNEQSNRYTPERFPCTQYFEDSTQEEKKISQDYKDKNSAKVDDEAGMEETRMRGYELCKMEEISPEIGTDGRYRRFEVEHCSMQSPDEMEDDDITSDSSEKHFTPNPCALLQPAEVSPDVGCETFPGVTQRAELAKHQSVHITAKPFSCSECGKGFTKKRNLVEHQNVHTGTNQYSCSECGKCFARRRNLISHQRIHSAEKPFSCTVCGKCFIQKQQLIAHQRTHTAEKPFSCSECGKSFTQRVTLISHQRTHTGERPFSCLECGKCYTNRSHLSTHQLVHMSVRMFSCPQCGKCFTRRGSLISHQRSHTGEKPFSCSECGKCFTRRASLIVHQRTHTGEKPYSCLECGRCFNEKANLVTHQMVHTGDRPYSCSVCGKGFSTKSNLVKHHQVHISIKMHACSECGKQFPNKLTLISHLSSHSRQKAPGSETIAS